MTAIALDVELELEVATLTMWDRTDGAIDPLADCARAWCDDSAGPTLVVGGFCECCGARDHDDI
ncbi:hypothetical protein FE374_00720 [Georgenia yuyongxinii]|uniref:Uncharacterized protein n=1 Tax=Georgenia yuyongxinii TaxID=2589797 RepID=A0A5B8BYH2_9MICO|nr:hypothetical protein [Georgenia yuyongxinii]QDC23344.1 hypothetical protein FE374_00720 [Georgenia yuyongxinii]